MRTAPTAVAILLMASFLATPAARAAGLPDRQPEREHEPQRLTLEELAARVAGSASQAAVGQRFGNGERAAVGPSMPWTALGPRPLAAEYWSSNRPASGRANAIAIDPRDADRAYVATAQGGVWRSENAGLSWTALTDQLPSLASGDVALDPVQPDTVWYGTGEQNFSGDSYYGDGLFRSTDRGATWVKMADRSQVGAYISRVVPRAGAPGTIVVASDLGLVRSTDGGDAWASVSPAPGYATDLVVDPVNRLHLLGAISGRGIYLSLDGGAMWTLQSVSPLPPAFGRVNLGIATDGQRAYASFVSGSGALAAMARSSDGGASWTGLAGVPDYLLTQGWYDNAVAVDPANPDVVVAGGVYPYTGTNAGILRSTNGGASWTNITRGTDGLGVHPDQHRLVYGQDGRLWVANDGGVFVSEDGGDNWKARNDGLETLQFYTVGLHATNPSRMSGGTQDNGTAYYEGSAVWPQLVAGDGGPTGFEWASPNTLYSTYVNLDPLYKWNATSFVGTVTGGWSNSGQPADWANGGFAIDPDAAATVLVGTNRVWRTKNGGATWTEISSNLSGGAALKAITVVRGAPGTIWAGSSNGRAYLTTNDGLLWSSPVAGLPLAGAINDIAVRPGSGLDAILGVDRASGDRVFRLDPVDTTWRSITHDLPAGLRVQSLAVDWRGTNAHVFVGTDHGVYAMLDSTWFLAGSGLPGVAVYDLAIDATAGWLVAATHGRSMWRTAIDGTVPAVAALFPNGGEELALGSTATFTWSASDASGVSGVDLVLEDAANVVSRVVATNVPNTGSRSWLVTPPLSDDVRLRVTARDSWGNVGDDLSDAAFRITGQVGVARAGLPEGVSLTAVGPNPSRGDVRIEWALSLAGEARLSVIDLQGREVASLASGAFAAGRHGAVWDGRAMGAPAPPGVYFVRIEAAGGSDVRRLMLAR